MKIVLVTYALHVGGVETFLRLLTRCFLASGHEICFLETFEKGRWSQSFEDEGYPVVRVLPQPFHSRIHHVNCIADFLSNYDVVILNDAPYAQAALGLLSENIVALPVLHMYLTSMIRNAMGAAGSWDALVAVCPAAEKSAIHFGADPCLVTCIPNGIVVADEYPRKYDENSENAPLRICFVGSVNHSQKGVLYLIGIVKQLLTDNIGITLDIVGDGTELSQIRKEFAPLGHQVILHGAVPNDKAQEILSRMDVLVMPSLFEGLPLVLLEAMSHGVVPVVSRLDGCTDFVVTDSHDGFLVQVGDEEGFACALKQLACDRNQLRKMSVAAWRTACKRFSYKTTADAYLSLIEECLDRKEKGNGPKRSGEIDTLLLGGFPALPLILVRPLRKLLRLIGLYPEPKSEPLLHIPDRQ